MTSMRSAVTVDSSQDGSDAAPQSTLVERGRLGGRARVFSLVSGVVVLIVLFTAASRYQPLVLTPSWTSSSISSSDEATSSLIATLSNTGPLGVSVLALHMKVYADLPVVVSPPMPCSHYFGIVRGCVQKKNGFFAGNHFHPFALTGDNKIPVTWQYSFSCRPNVGGSSTGGPVEVHVTYRFAWFTHTTTLVIPNVGTSGGSSCIASG